MMDNWIIKITDTNAFYRGFGYNPVWTHNLNLAQRFFSKKAALQETLQMLGNFEVILV